MPIPISEPSPRKRDRIDRWVPLAILAVGYALLMVWTWLLPVSPFNGESIRPLAWAFWSLTVASPLWWLIRRPRRRSESGAVSYGEQVVIVIASLFFAAGLVRLIDQISVRAPSRSYVLILSEVHSKGKYPYVIMKSLDSGVTRKVSQRDTECVWPPDTRVLVIETAGILGIGVRRYQCQD